MTPAIQAMRDWLRTCPLVASAQEDGVAFRVGGLTGDAEVGERVWAGAASINVAAGRRTPDVVQQIRQRHPSIPLLASGGSTDESMAETIVAGANALTWTPPNAQEMQRSMMMRYRGESTGDNMQH